MTRSEIIAEIRRVETALQNTDSRKLRHDYGKYLKRLYQNLRYYDRHMSAHKANKRAETAVSNLNG